MYGVRWEFDFTWSTWTASFTRTISWREWPFPFVCSCFMRPCRGSVNCVVCARTLDKRWVRRGNQGQHRWVIASGVWSLDFKRRAAEGGISNLIGQYSRVGSRVTLLQYSQPFCRSVTWREWVSHPGRLGLTFLTWIGKGQTFLPQRVVRKEWTMWRVLLHRAWHRGRDQ